ncbi:hypothetical protein BV898_13312 [Hypsibius exemplaris]|uniref:Uncharacterized protein n=1 Tax=Hypsibius exemplaris TaxID=2072580 RepID=A0A1W0WB40_HYPEX|nr:hypothetical protein BV898_13312 [Hypsibius exemplaris]
MGEDICGNSTCYNPSKLTCFGDQLCKKGLLPMPASNNTCYDPSSRFYALGKTWPMGHILCKNDGATVSIDPALQTCFGDRACPNGQLPVPSPGSSECYDPTTRYYEGEGWIPIRTLMYKQFGKAVYYDPSVMTCHGNRTCKNSRLPIPTLDSECYDPTPLFTASIADAASPQSSGFHFQQCDKVCGRIAREQAQCYIANGATGGSCRDGKKFCV